MKKTLNLLLAGLCVFFFAACENPQQGEQNEDDKTEQGGTGNTGDIFKKDFPFVED